MLQVCWLTDTDDIYSQGAKFGTEWQGIFKHINICYLY